MGGKGQKGQAGQEAAPVHSVRKIAADQRPQLGSQVETQGEGPRASETPARDAMMGPMVRKTLWAKAPTTLMPKSRPKGPLSRRNTFQGRRQSGPGPVLPGGRRGEEGTATRIPGTWPPRDRRPTPPGPRRQGDRRPIRGSPPGRRRTSGAHSPSLPKSSCHGGRRRVENGAPQPSQEKEDHKDPERRGDAHEGEENGGKRGQGPRRAVSRSGRRDTP